jgi:hypothetical protein
VLTALLCASAQAQTANNYSKKPTPIPNAKRYSSKGLHPATGRSGSATLTVRALLGKDGQTDVELTTGALDSAQPPPGNIKKAQLKPLSQDGDALYARNYSGLNGGGYFVAHVNDLHHLQQVQAQANIDGIDARRTSVVTVVETVKKRPDLALSDLKPGTGLVGTPVVISVLARELNGDVGATANAVLYVDGQEADRANGIFVAAGDAVTVAFTKVFTSAGAKQIEVRLESVAPGDYDAANNSIAGSLAIILPNDTLNYTASFVDQTDAFTSKETHDTGNNDPLTGWLSSSSTENTSSSATQSVSFDGYAPRRSAFPYQLAVGETGDGATFSDTLSFAAPDGNFAFDFGGFHYAVSYAFAADPAQNVRAFVSNIEYTSNGSPILGETDVQYTRFGGTVTYHSAGFSRYWYLVNGTKVFDNDFTYNNDISTDAGTRLPVGTQFGLTLVLTAGDDQVFSASPVMNITAMASSFISPQTCSVWRFPDPPATIFDFGTDCEQSSGSIIIKSGSVTFNGAP